MEVDWPVKQEEKQAKMVPWKPREKSVAKMEDCLTQTNTTK